MCRALRAGFVFRRSSVSVSILTRTALQNVWSLRKRARLARRSSVFMRLIAFSAQSRATSSGCGGRLVVVVVFDRMVLERQAFVEFGERNREANLRHLEGVVILEDKGAPSVLGADEDGRAYTLLLEHDVSLDGGRRLVLAGLDDAVLGGGAGTQHLEDHHGVSNGGGGWGNGRTNDHPVGIAAATTTDQNLKVAPVKLARFPAQAASKRGGNVGLNIGVSRRSSGHCNGLGAVEFVPLLLPLLPCEEFGERHRLPHGEVHGRQSSTVAHGGLPWL